VAGPQKSTNGLTLYPARPYAPGVPGPQDDEGSFAAGRQSLLDALQSLEQRAKERADRMVRDAERAARQLTIDSEQHATQLISEAEERARQTVAEAEQRARQMTIEAAQRLAELEQQLTEVRDNLGFARGQIEEQIVSVSGQVELARASLNTVRQQMTGAAGRVVEAVARIPSLPRPTIPRLSSETPTYTPPPAPPAEVAGPNLNDLRAAVDALKKPRRPERVDDPEEASTNNADETSEHQTRH
jgi:vacuolar-type H+-ATPase subunit H